MLLFAIGMFFSVFFIIKRSVFIKAIFSAAINLFCYLALLTFVVVTFSSAFKKSRSKGG